MAHRPMAINTAFCRSNVHAQFGVSGVPKTTARRLVNKCSFVALVPNDTTCVEYKHHNRTFHSDVTRRVTWSSAATGWQKREVGGYLPCVYALQ